MFVFIGECCDQKAEVDGGGLDGSNGRFGGARMECAMFISRILRLGLMKLQQEKSRSNGLNDACQAHASAGVFNTPGAGAN